MTDQVKTRLTLLCEERTVVKKHMLELQNAMFKTFFVFITVAGVVAGIYFNENIFKHTEKNVVEKNVAGKTVAEKNVAEKNITEKSIAEKSTTEKNAEKNATDKSADPRKIVIICLTQVEVLLTLFFLSVSAPINVSVGYLRSVDKQINKLCGNKMTNMWEAEIARKYIWSRDGATIWGSTVIAIFLFIIYCFFTYIGWSSVNNFLGRLIIAVETIAIISLLIRSMSELDKVEEFADTMFNKPLD